MNKTKVAVVYHYYAHYRSTIIEELVASKKIDFRFYSDDSSDLGIKCIPETLFARKWSKLQNLHVGPFLWQRGLLKKILFSDFDAFILLGNVNFFSTWVALVLAKLLGKKTYLWTHGTLSVETGLKRLVRILFYRLSTGLFLYSHKAHSDLIKMGLPSDKQVKVVYNSLNYRLSSQLVIDDGLVAKKKSSLIQGFKYDLIFCGRIIENRGLEELVMALSLLAKRGRIVSLLVVGDGAYSQHFKARIKSEKLDDSIEFAGAIYEEKILIDLFSQSHFLIMPGDIGLSAIHALTYFTPVITHNVLDTHKPEYEALTEGLTSFGFDKGCADSMANTIENLLKKDVYSQEFFDECSLVMKEKYNATVQRDIICEAMR